MGANTRVRIGGIRLESRAGLRNLGIITFLSIPKALMTIGGINAAINAVDIVYAWIGRCHFVLYTWLETHCRSFWRRGTSCSRLFKMGILTFNFLLELCWLSMVTMHNVDWWCWQWLATTTILFQRRHEKYAEWNVAHVLALYTITNSVPRGHRNRIMTS